MHNFTIVTTFGLRTWQADDSDHAVEQHMNAFLNDPDEKIIEILDENGDSIDDN